MSQPIGVGSSSGGDDRQSPDDDHHGWNGLRHVSVVDRVDERRVDPERIGAPESGSVWYGQDVRVTEYSGKTLTAKLGIAPGSALVVLDDPGHADALLAPLPDGVVVRRRLGGHADVVLIFASKRADVKRRVPALRRTVAPAGSVWVCWTKKTSPLWTGISEQDWRDDLLPTGLVDTKVCAVDEDWSGLKFVIRKDLRGEPIP